MGRSAVGHHRANPGRLADHSVIVAAQSVSTHGSSPQRPRSRPKSAVDEFGDGSLAHRTNRHDSTRDELQNDTQEPNACTAPDTDQPYRRRPTPSTRRPIPTATDHKRTRGRVRSASGIEGGKRMTAAIIDLDGTVYRSKTAIPGARDGIERLRDAGVDVAFVTNSATKSRTQCLERLESIGIDAEESEILTSATVTASYVASEYPEATAMAVGEPALFEELSRADVSLTEEPADCDVLVAGKDRSFDFETLTRSLHALEAGATFVGTNRDRKSPTDTGNEPGSGALIAAIEFAAEREPDIVAGKPNDPIIEVSLDHLDADASECLVIGDNPETDIRMGTRAGMTTVLVLTGLVDRTDPAATNGDADHVLESLGAIESVLSTD
ncbi:HAD-IIA family hydrolase [Natrarchaeobius sp. A-rgal3]|uniref:HAD-IIA family hydrolase n=1 Tax=Natrarchaeobius versutus TaxID=1679078 RepID=UPI00350FB5A7